MDQWVKVFCLLVFGLDIILNKYGPSQLRTFSLFNLPFFLLMILHAEFKGTDFPNHVLTYKSDYLNDLISGATLHLFVLSLKVVTNEKGEAVGEVVTIIC